MSKESIVEKMVSFIENAEKNLQASQFANEGKTSKSDIVDNILDELENKVNNEN